MTPYERSPASYPRSKGSEAASFQSSTPRWESRSNRRVTKMGNSARSLGSASRLVQGTAGKQERLDPNRKRGRAPRAVREGHCYDEPMRFGAFSVRLGWSFPGIELGHDRPTGFIEYRHEAGSGSIPDSWLEDVDDEEMWNTLVDLLGKKLSLKPERRD